MNRRFILAGVCLFGSIAAPLTTASDRDLDDHDSPAVYTQTNDAASNAVMVYRRTLGGVLHPVGPVATGGKGTGAGLGSQGAIALASGRRWLIAVNAGSNDISVLRASESGLKLASRTSSGGQMPISVTISGRTVYVLNAGMPNNITGFSLAADGSLTPIPNSTRSLSGPSVGPAEVSFSAEGDFLVVTEKGTNLIDVFPVDSHGVAGNRVTTPSHGMTPFGFAFGKRNRLFVSEAFGGSPNASAASSYNLGESGVLLVISGSVPTHETAACWLVVSNDGRFAYTTNTGSKNVSLYRIDAAGRLTLVSADAGSTPAGGAIDAAFSADGRYLHVLTAGAASIVTFRVQADGSLTHMNTAMAPPGAVGMAAE